MVAQLVKKLLKIHVETKVHYRVQKSLPLFIISHMNPNYKSLCMSDFFDIFLPSIMRLIGPFFLGYLTKML